MADKKCFCGNLSLGNTGRTCVSIMDVAAGGLLDMAVDSSGALKERNNADLQSLASVETALNATDARDRLFYIGKFEQVDHLREDPVFWTANSGKQSFIRDGLKTFQAAIVNAPRELVGKLNENKCQKFGIHFLDESNQIANKKGSTTTTGRPILVDNDTFHAWYVEATNDAPAMVMIQFQWKQSEKDENIQVFGDLNYNYEDLYGLLDADAVYSSITVNGFTATITDSTFHTPVTGLVLGDFTLTEISPVPGDNTGNIASVTESADGVYDFVFTAPETSGDVLRLSAVKSKYDFSAMSDATNDITIP